MDTHAAETSNRNRSPKVATDTLNSYSQEAEAVERFKAASMRQVHK